MPKVAGRRAGAQTALIDVVRAVPVLDGWDSPTPSGSERFFHEPLPDRSYRDLLSGADHRIDGRGRDPLRPGTDAGLVAVLLSEALFTFALALVVLNVATDDATAGNSFYGLAIGFTVMIGAFAVGPVSGGAFNPAVGTGPILVDTFVGEGSLTHLWIHLVGPIPGGVAAAAVFDLQHLDGGEA